jgi:glucose/arabinose dehydrogenase
MLSRKTRTIIVTVQVLLAATAIAGAATFADKSFTETSLATNLDGTAMDFAPDGRLFVCSKSGALRVYKDNQLLTKPFVKLSVSTNSEQGLLGIAFHPKFPDSNWVYVYYTLPARTNRVSRFKADGDTALGGVAGEQVVFEIPNGNADNHDGGAIHFGNDGKLYVSSGNRAGNTALDMTTVLGKILRLNEDGGIPSDNPFLAQTTGAAQAIYTAGMRNTFTFSVDKVTGRMFGCEVGDGSEEVNELLPGHNYGYGKAEGYTIPTNTTGIVGTFKPAIYSYNGGCIIAASFYSPTGTGFPGTRNFPASFHRKFFFADYNNSWMRVLDIDDPKTVTDFATGTGNPVDIKFDKEGVMYYLNRGSGGLYRVVYTAGASLLQPQRRATGRRYGLEVLGLRTDRRLDGRLEAKNGRLLLFPN